MVRQGGSMKRISSIALTMCLLAGLLVGSSPRTFAAASIPLVQPDTQYPLPNTQYLISSTSYLCGCAPTVYGQ